MADRLLGKEVNQALLEDLKARSEELQRADIEPCLAVVRVGEREEDLSYERGALKKCEKAGVICTKRVFPADVTEDELLKTIRSLNEDQSVHGILLFRPLPKHLNERKIINEIAPAKDVDGVTDISMAGVYSGSDRGFPPCTAQAVMEILHHYGIPVEGKKAVIIGRSLVIGRPVAMMLMKKNATVTICHTRTKDPAAEARQADILVAAAGRAGLVGSSYTNPGQTVIDVGIHVNDEGKMCGDVAFDEVEPAVRAITPVPGGVGSVTTTVLAEHVIRAAERTLSK
ncbi:MAG: bifunctional 5,10-methylenetetrahydrofolate dehydrogenase/5,10-methenyltetrahydrofolate cyclohydrolase [Lachnospiraceae bacterium]|nr:bifunctional 5,10-methylenetetrahydrofolate dehydrogenase/5,10-methenyltetrahydrofolate cyclohydrolase [Lachnospiraceae bacterium]